ncbi:MAG: acetate--CoA ligase family protein [Candidatus Lernaella stagnicola]|nr:acetate--CoA ligase family protein [Candidatus Lernaella stagnicola]
MDSDSSSMKYLFEPRGVAVVGASTNPDKIGSKVVANILASGYKGGFYPINPRPGECCGVPMIPSLAAADGPIDLACICIPAKYVIASVKECAAVGVKHVAIITSGFSEVGNLEDEQRIVEIAREAGMRVLGPNIFGVYSRSVDLNASFGPREVQPGGVAIVTQSGALGIAMMGRTKSENIGLSAVVSVGNKCDLDEADLLEHLVEDPNTKAILLYIEGVKQGDKFVRVLSEATRKKPIVVLKSGRSKRGAAAAASHTGSLAGADEVFSAIMRQCGALRAENIQDALNWCKFMATSAPPPGDATVIITNGGGMGVLATDACEKYGVDLYDDVSEMEKIFRDATPDFGSMKNPIDITGGAFLEDYDKAIAAAIDHEKIDSIIVLGCQTAVLDGKNLTRTIDKALDYNDGRKPMVFSFLGGKDIETATDQMRRQAKPVFDEVYEAVSCLGAAYGVRRNRQIEPGDPGVIAELAAGFDQQEIRRILAEVRADDRRFLLAHESSALMAAAGISMPQSLLARNIHQAVIAAEKIGYPVVMKIVSKDVIHKSDAGGIALDLENKAEVLDAFEAIMHNVREHNPDAAIEGVEVVEQVREGVETIIGARRDPSFGPIVMFGLGGIYVEVMKDVTFRALPVSLEEARRMVQEIRAFPLLMGVRGEKQKDVNALLDTILRVGAVLQTFDDIGDIEINPLVVYDQSLGAKTVDARILLRQ